MPPPRNIDPPMGAGSSLYPNLAAGTQAPWATATLRTGASDHSTSLASMMQPPGSNYRYGSDYGDWAGNASMAGLDTQSRATGVIAPMRAPWADASTRTGMPSIPASRASGVGRRGGGSRGQGSKGLQPAAPPPTTFPRGAADPDAKPQPSGPV